MAAAAAVPDIPIHGAERPVGGAAVARRAAGIRTGDHAVLAGVVIMVFCGLSWRLQRG